MFVEVNVFKKVHLFTNMYVNMIIHFYRYQEREFSSIGKSIFLSIYTNYIETICPSRLAAPSLVDCYKQIGMQLSGKPPGTRKQSRTLCYNHAGFIH